MDSARMEESAGDSENVSVSSATYQYVHVLNLVCIQGHASHLSVE